MAKFDKDFLHVSVLVTIKQRLPKLCVYALDKTMEKQAADLKNILSSYDRDKKHWATTVNDLQEKIKVLLKISSRNDKFLRYMLNSYFVLDS